MNIPQILSLYLVSFYIACLSIMLVRITNWLQVNYYANMKHDHTFTIGPVNFIPLVFAAQSVANFKAELIQWLHAGIIGTALCFATGAF